MGYLDSYDFDGEYITWTTDGANAGTVFYRTGKFNCTNVCGTIKLTDNSNPFYVAHVLQLKTKKFVSINLANPKLMNNVMGTIEVGLPEIEIQNSTATLLETIDKKIGVETQIYLLQSRQKQYLLANMFR